MKYNITIAIKEHGTATIEAKNAKEAKLKAEKLEQEGGFEWWKREVVEIDVIEQ